jgi:phage/plasmid-like protein (TIGR03299 family)
MKNDTYEAATELHTLEETATTAAGRSDILAKFGHRVPSRIDDLDGLLAHGDMAYTAISVPSYAKIDGKMVRDKESFHIVRADTSEIIGRVGKRFTVVQNRDAFDIAQSLVTENIANFDLVGHFRPAVPFISLILPDRKIMKEVVKPRIMLTHGLDGSRGVTAAFIAERLFCTNQLAVAEKPYNIRHTKTAGVRLNEAQRLVMDFETNLKALELSAPLMAKRMLTDKERLAFFKAVYGVKGKDEKTAVWEEKVLYHLDRLSVQGHGNAEYEGSTWAAYNAVTEFEDWGKGFNRKGTKLSNKIETMYFGDGAKTKFKALKEALTLIN